MRAADGSDGGSSSRQLDEDWLSEALDGIGLDGEVYAPFVSDMVGASTSDASTTANAVATYLTEVLEDGTDGVSELAQTIKERLEAARVLSEPLDITDPAPAEEPSAGESSSSAAPAAPSPSGGESAAAAAAAASKPSGGEASAAAAPPPAPTRAADAAKAATLALARAKAKAKPPRDLLAPPDNRTAQYAKDKAGWAKAQQAKDAERKSQRAARTTREEQQERERNHRLNRTAAAEREEVGKRAARERNAACKDMARRRKEKAQQLADR